MTKAERSAYVAAKLEELYPETPIPLDHRDPYTLLIAVLLSAQCTDERVNKITPPLFALAATPQAMALVPVEKIREIIRPCGLSPRKSVAISELSKILIDRHGGEVPVDFAALEELPGVGARLSRRYPHPPPRPALEADLRQKRRRDRARFKASLPPRELEQAPSPDHLLRPRALLRPRLQRYCLRYMPDALSGEGAGREDAEVRRCESL
jgi:hypothetical protein